MGDKTGELFGHERAWQIAIDIMRAENPDGGTRAAIAGSLRRGKAFVHDIDILVCRSNPGIDMLHRYVPFGDGRTIQVDTRYIKPASWGSALQYFTGSWRHNVSVRRVAKAKGLLANEYGVFDFKGEKIDDGTEAGFYKALGLRWMPPEYREGYFGEAAPLPTWCVEHIKPDFCRRERVRLRRGRFR